MNEDPMQAEPELAREWTEIYGEGEAAAVTPLLQLLAPCCASNTLSARRAAVPTST